MSETPETDEYAKADWWTLFRDTEHARILERERDEAREAFVIATDQMVIAQGKVREANKERDEARELLASEKITRNHIIKRSVEVERERDEAIRLLKLCADYSLTTHQCQVEEFLKKIK